MCAGYVEQFDTLLPELTVTEMLMYTAELKRKRREPLAVRTGQDCCPSTYLAVGAPALTRLRSGLLWR